MENNSLARERDGGSKPAGKNYSSAVDQLKESAGHMRDEVGKVSTIAKEAASEQFSEISKVTSEKIDDFSNYVKAKPLTSLAVVGALAYFLGFLSRR